MKVTDFAAAMKEWVLFLSHNTGPEKTDANATVLWKAAVQRGCIAHAPTLILLSFTVGSGIGTVWCTEPFCRDSVRWNRSRAMPIPPATRMGPSSLWYGIGCPQGPSMFTTRGGGEGRGGLAGQRSLLIRKRQQASRPCAWSADERITQVYISTRSKQNFTAHFYSVGSLSCVLICPLNLNILYILVHQLQLCPLQRLNSIHSSRLFASAIAGS